MLRTIAVFMLIFSAISCNQAKENSSTKIVMLEDSRLEDLNQEISALEIKLKKLISERDVYRESVGLLPDSGSSTTSQSYTCTSTCRSANNSLLAQCGGLSYPKTLDSGSKAVACSAKNGSNPYYVYTTFSANSADEAQSMMSSSTEICNGYPAASSSSWKVASAEAITDTAGTAVIATSFASHGYDIDGESFSVLYYTGNDQTQSTQGSLSVKYCE